MLETKKKKNLFIWDRFKCRVSLELPPLGHSNHPFDCGRYRGEGGQGPSGDAPGGGLRGEGAVKNRWSPGHAAITKTRGTKMIG